MPSRRRRGSMGPGLLGLLAAGLVLASPVTAQPAFPAEAPRSLEVLTVAPRVDLLEVDDQEIVRGRSMAEASVGTVRIVRTLPAVWRYRIPAESFDAPHVRAELVGADGAPGRLTHAEHEGSEIRVLVRPLTPEIVEQDESSRVFEGGVELILDLSHARVSGHYSGTLIVSLHSL